MEKFIEKQYGKLSKLLLYLKYNNTYWGRRLAIYTEEELSNLEKIKEIYSDINVITKNVIIQNFENYIDNKILTHFDNDAETMTSYLLDTERLNKNHDKYLDTEHGRYTVETTSGTTGKPFPIVKNSTERFIAANYLLKCRREYCSDANLKNGFLLAHEVDDFLKNNNFLDSKSDMKEVVDYFIEKRPKWMFVTANTIKRFTRAIKKSNKEEEVSAVGIQFIEVTAAKLADEEKAEIEDIFGAPIKNQYGCREVWNIAYECKCGKMHINNSNLMVDLIDESGCLIDNENEVGEVVVTSLYNKTLPFVKYYLGDYASYSFEKCECGAETPILELAGGRKVEKLKNTQYFGTPIFRRVLRVLYFNKGLRYGNVKIVQDDEYHLTVYLDECSDWELFEDKFIEISNVMIENFGDFKVDFRSKYPFKDDTVLKENIFISKVV